MAVHIARHPGVGRLRPEVTIKADRFVTLSRFPYVVVYDPGPTPPAIVRVLHGARDLPTILQEL
jgi:toxin ParE1/3/4